MKLSAKGAAFIQKFEDCKLSAYLDQARVWTIGWGHTGKGVKQGTNWTQEKADANFLLDVAIAESAVSDNVKVALTQSQFDALVSFTFNCGIEAFLGSTLLKVLNEGNYAGAADQILLWNKTHINGQLVVSDGLTKRRFAESTMFKQKDETPCPPSASQPIQSLVQFLKSIFSGFFTWR